MTQALRDSLGAAVDAMAVVIDRTQPLPTEPEEGATDQAPEGISK